MVKIIKYLIFFICIIGQIQTSIAKKISILEAGIYGGVSNYTHTVDFYELPGFVNYGPPYETASSLNMTLGLFGEYRINSLFSFQTRIGYLPLNIELKAREFIGNQEINNDLVHVYSNHSLNTYLSMLTISPIIIINPFNNVGFYLSVGTNFGIFIENNATQFEKLDDDIFNSGIEFSDGSNNQGQERNKVSNELLVNKSLYSFVVGIGYKYKVTDKLSIALHGDYNYWMMNVFPQKEWKLTNSTVSLNISYSIVDEDVQEIEVDEVPPIEVLTPQNNDIQTERKFETPEIEPVQDAPQKTECYYIIFATSEDNELINNLFESMNGSGFEEMYLKKYYDNKDKITYHRLCSKCFSNIEDLTSYFQQLEEHEIMKKFSSYYFKLGDEDFEK